jgi:1,4-alpha-glucan branching enzyme
MKTVKKLVEQEFFYSAPGALRVQLLGSFTQWQGKPISMSEDEGGIWRVKVNLSPGTHNYRFIVDGEWNDDPMCTLQIPTHSASRTLLEG